jgi:hypothetical protein
MHQWYFWRLKPSEASLVIIGVGHISLACQAQIGEFPAHQPAILRCFPDQKPNRDLQYTPYKRSPIRRGSLLSDICGRRRPVNLEGDSIS